MSESEGLESSVDTDCRPIPVAQVSHLNLLPSTSWDYPGPATLRYLSRQKRRAETVLCLKAVIVQDERGFVALWTGEPREPNLDARLASNVTDVNGHPPKPIEAIPMRDRQRDA